MREISERNHLFIDMTKALTRDLLTAIIAEVRLGSIVSLPGIGLFEAKWRGERKRFDPIRGYKPMVMPKYLTLTFRPTERLKKMG